MAWPKERDDRVGRPAQRCAATKKSKSTCGETGELIDSSATLGVKIAGRVRGC